MVEGRKGRGRECGGGVVRGREAEGKKGAEEERTREAHQRAMHDLDGNGEELA